MADQSPIPSDIVALADYERAAATRLDAAAWAYLAGGAADGLTLRRNREAFDAIRLQPRVLWDMAGASTRTELLGTALAHPILLAPIASHRLFHPDGERAVAVAAGATGTGMVVSTEATTSLEDIPALAKAPFWFQLYMQADRGFTQSLVARAEAAGYGAIVVTVDAPVSLRNEEQRIGFRLPAGLEPVNLRGMPSRPAIQAGPTESPVFRGLLDGAPGWADLEWLCAVTQLPVLAKGILGANDAERAVAAGVAGIVVSNHGGRALDGAPATIEALPAIAERIKGRVPLLLDGGIRRGTDVVKALALGASAVLLGRPYVMALAVGGVAGVAHALTIIRTELEVAMTLTGCASIEEIDESVIWRA